VINTHEYVFFPSRKFWGAYQLEEEPMEINSELVITHSGGWTCDDVSLHKVFSPQHDATYEELM
jgi:hypothetical protein